MNRDKEPHARPAPQFRSLACNTAKHLWRTLENRKLRFRRELSLAGDSAGGGLAAAWPRMKKL